MVMVVFDPAVPAGIAAVVVAALAAPGTTWMVGSVEETVVPLIVPVIVVALPASTPVNVAVYAPFAWSEAGVGVMVPVLLPPPTPNPTVSPPEVRLFPAASRAWSVSVVALPELSWLAPTVMLEVTAEAVPATTVTVGSVDVTGFPPIVALMVLAVPTFTPVKLAEYVPSA
jgi:hypothetical protein